MKILTVGNIVEACNGKLVNGDEFKDKEIEGAAIDSRKVEKDYLFFAFKGEKVDGHDFIKAAFDNGAAAVVCEHVPEGEEGICIVVENTVEALKKIATYYREKLSVKVVGVTGSIGKTTTKEFIATVLSQKYNVYRTSKNQNNLIGLPLSVLNISENNEVAVLEMGISEFGEMRQLSEIAKPDICVITNISTCHLETLGSLDGVFKAKTEIFEHMNPEGYVCVCGDDERLSKIDDVNGKKPITFGFDETNEVHPTKILNRGLWGSECTVENGEGIFDISVPLAGRHMICDALAAVSVARILELTPEQVSFGISMAKSLQGRNNLMQKNGITIIDDCYNASPESMKSALDLLTEAITPTVAILGDMYEQGENEDRSHEEIGEYAAKKGINTICCVGPLSKKMYDKAMSIGSVNENTEVIYFETVDETIEKLKTFIKKDDTVLLKASNGMKFNRILDELTKDDVEFEKREEKLFKKSSVANADLDELMSEIKNVGSKTEAEAKENASAVNSATEPAGTTTETKASKKQKSADQKEKESARKQLIIIVAIVAAVLIIAAIVFGIVRHNNYKKATQGEIVYQINSSYIVKGMIEDSTIAESQSMMVWDTENENVPLRYDGKYFYYATGSEANYDLHYVKKGKDIQTVEGKVKKYDVLNKNRILYLSNNNLYTLNAKNSETNLVAENVEIYYLGKNKKEIVYRTYSGNLCSMRIDKPDTLKALDEGVNGITYTDEKLKNVIYMKNEGLFISRSGKKIINIAADARDIYIAKEEGNKLYYTDTDSNLWYFSFKSKKPKKVSDDGRRVFGKEFGYSSLMTMSGDGNWKFIKDGKEYILKDFTPGQGMQMVGADKKKAYFISRDAATGVSNLYSVSSKGIGNKKKVTIESSNVDTVEYLDDGYIFVCKDDGSGNKDLYSKETLVARNIQPGSVDKTEYGKDFVFAYQVSDDEGFYKIAMYNGKTIKEIGSSLDMNVTALSRKKVIYRTKGQGNMFDIKTYNGRKSKVYKEGVSDYTYIQY